MLIYDCLNDEETFFYFNDAGRCSMYGMDMSFTDAMALVNKFEGGYDSYTKIGNKNMSPILKKKGQEQAPSVTAAVYANGMAEYTFLPCSLDGTAGRMSVIIIDIRNYNKITSK
jgi:hypothetical protein